MIFNPLIVVASELGIGRPTDKPRSGAERQSMLVSAYRRVRSSELGSVIVDSIADADAEAVAAEGAYTVKTDLGEIDRRHNYRSDSGAERIAATVNRFDRFYSHDVVIAVPDDMPELKPFYLQALMYALATTEVGIATLVSPLENGELANNDIAKAAVTWNPDRIVYPVEGSRVGTLLDIRRDATLLPDKDCYKLVPIHALAACGARPRGADAADRARVRRGHRSNARAGSRYPDRRRPGDGEYEGADDAGRAARRNARHGPLMR